MTNLPELFGSMVFNEATMKAYLPKDIFKALKKTIDEGAPLDLSVANVVANAMKDWAISKGATHFTHWFQPMTGITAEKHDSFISPAGGGSIIMEFSGKELIKGEPDASSFPSGGIRATFEARGYTAWDPTSYAFIKDGTLCIPTAFCSYTGEALDEKTPLLRSMKAISTQAMRILKLFDNPAKRVTTTVGSEQEYFIIDREAYNKRKDLIYAGRTLFGAKPPKGQELDDYYFGMIKTRVSAYMKDLDEELWKLGILAKTEHNEVAPAQHELAPIYDTTNIAVDHNQLTMEIMRKTAKKHGLTCLLHEKPFAGINGSGKHNNWSLSTDLGENLLEPGKSPEENAQFLTFLCAVIKATDKYQDLLRISVASAGNDHRLGANEAPPAIVSIFLGEELGAIIDSIANDTDYDKKEHGTMDIGVDILPTFPKDTTDRNRTSPFAFTGNKFEFRMLGSSASVAASNTVLNTIVADALCDFADTLEAADDFKAALNKLIRDTIKEHQKIIFNGNGYDESWISEAEKRGLMNLKKTPDAVPHLTDEKNVKVFEKFGVYSKIEVEARREIMLENYCKKVNIEARTMLEMAKTDILPAVISFAGSIGESILAKKSACKELPCKADTDLLVKVSELTDKLAEKISDLESVENTATGMGTGDYTALAKYYGSDVIFAMDALREVADELETMVSKNFWPYSSYGRLLYLV